MSLQLPFSESLVIIGEDGRHRIAPPRRGRIVHRYGARVELWLNEEPTGAGAGPLKLEPALLASLSDIERAGVEAFQLRRSPAFEAAKAARPRQGEPWDMTGCVGSGPADLAARAAGMSDYLEGSVAVGFVIVNGPSAGLRFSPTERTKVLGEAQTGLGYLAAVNAAANVTFAYDIRVVDIDVPANPNAADLEAVFRDAALAKMGFASTKDYVAKIRADLGTQWAYAAFFTKYPVGHFAYADSLRVVMHWDNDGWGHDNIDRVFAHETGHVFGCPDEYAASKCMCGGAHGRFGHPNDNCENCAPPPGGGMPCIMKNNDWAMCNATHRHLGWMAPVRSPDRAWVTAVSSQTDRLDVFTVDKSQWIRTAFWEPGMTEWFQGWLHVLGGQTKPGSPVTAVSRRPGHLDVFVVDLNNRVCTAARDPGGDWKGWWAIGDLMVPQGGYIGAVSRSIDQLDIFAVDVEGRTMTASWAPWHPNGWSEWREINGGRAAPGAPITAVSRNTDLLDIFVTGLTGGVATASWSPANTNGWIGWWGIGDVVLPQGGFIGAVSRSTDQLDIFAVDVQGRTMTTAWAPWHPNGWTDWREINGGLAVPGAPITAASRSKDVLDIYVTGITGGVATASWSPANSNGWVGWFHVNGGLTVPGTPVGVVSRRDDHLDAFVLGIDDRPATASWDPSMVNGWWGWSSMGA